MHSKVTKGVVLVIAAGMPLALGAGPAQAALALADAVTVPCGEGALGAAITAAGNGAILSLAPRCTYELTAALPAISQDLTIAGNDATVERSLAPGTPAFSILTVNPDVDLSVSNLNFRNGGSGAGGALGDTPAGGAIDNGGNLAVSGGNFTDNTAADGGAILNGDGSLNVTDAVFADNTANNGGAVENNGAMVLAGSTFTGNTASEFGGAVATAANSAGAKVTGCEFTGNTAGAGGGIWTTATSTVTGSQFRRNNAANGGSLFNDDSLTLTGSQVVGNTATSGGGMYNDLFGNATVTGTVFRQNHAVTGGGINNQDVATISGSHLLGNSADQLGGGIYTDWVLDVTGSFIVGNNAASGGGIYNDDAFGPPGTVTLSDSIVAANQPDNCAQCGPGSGPLRLRQRLGRTTRRHWPGGRLMTGIAAAVPARGHGLH